MPAERSGSALQAYGSREPAVKIGVTGHQKIPRNAKKFIAEQLDILLREANPLIGVTALAAGADQLFAASVLKHHGRLHVVIPSDHYEHTFLSSRDRSQYEKLLGQATTIEVLSFPEPSQQAFLAAGRHVVDLSDLVVGVWDGKPARGRGGTADIVRYARSVGKEVRLIWPMGTVR